jgi:glycosyltransferase involved in cell wall biosynthesis
MRVFGNGSINGVDAAEAFSPAKWTEERKAAMRWALNIPEDAHVVVFVGRVCRLKGLTELASAWREVREEFPSAHLLLAGEVDDRDPLPPEVMKSLKADPRVRQTGWVQDAAPVYAVADVFVLPSYHEGLPVTLLESAAMGLPAVATAIPGNTDVVTDGVTGTLVPVHDSAALAGAIGQYLRDPALGARHGRAGRARMLAEFRPHTVWDEIVAEYHRLARRGRRGR